MNDDDKIKITWDDVNQVSLPSPSSPKTSGRPSGERRYGTIAVGAPTDRGAVGPLWMRSWVYLGIGGLLGAFLGWAICEPSFVEDPSGARWGNHLMVLMVVILMCVGYAVAESVAEQSFGKLLFRAGLAVIVGAVLALLFQIAANLVYTVLLQLAHGGTSGPRTRSSLDPAAIVARAIGWAVFGAAGGVVYGIIGRSGRKGLYGVIGGMIGAGIGGLLFDPLAALSGLGGPSRAVGFSALGCLAGVAMGLVENAMKERWLYVVSGPLAGKQFILYKTESLIGRDPSADIYLFKDATILPEHATLSREGRSTRLRCVGEVTINGNRVHDATLQDGDRMQIGRFGFEFREQRRSS